MNIVYLIFGFTFLVVVNSATALGEGANPIIRGEPLTAIEALLLPPVCKLILIDRPSAHIDIHARRQNADVLALPQFRMARDAGHLHHWCWATVSRTRYFSARSAPAKWNYQSLFHNDMDYVIQNMRSSWEYMPQMHAEKGDMYFYDRNYVDALSEAAKALKQAPDYGKAFALQSKAYIALKQNEKALASATEGLKHNPNSRELKRLFADLGGKPPYPEPYVKETVQDAAIQAEDATNEPEVAAEPNKPPEAAASVPEPDGTDQRPKDNPYCRFCPTP